MVESIRTGKLKNKPNLPNQTYQTKPTKPDLPNQTYQTKPTKPNLPNQTYPTKPTKQNIPNQTYPTKPAQPNLPNQNYWSKQSTPGSVVPLAMFFFRIHLQWDELVISWRSLCMVYNKFVQFHPIFMSFHMDWTEIVFPQVPTNCLRPKNWRSWTKIPYLIFVIFFTLAKFLESKIYTEKRQFFALNL